MKVTYLGDRDVCEAQINWGGNDDPRGILNDGQVYEVERSEAHSWHTKIVLVDFPNKKFNSVHFK